MLVKLSGLVGTTCPPDSLLCTSHTSGYLSEIVKLIRYTKVICRILETLLYLICEFFKVLQVLNFGRKSESSQKPVEPVIPFLI